MIKGKEKNKLLARIRFSFKTEYYTVLTDYVSAEIIINTLDKRIVAVQITWI